MSGVAHDSRKTLAAFIMRPVGVLTLLAVLVTMGLIAYTRIPIQLLPAGWGSQTFTIFVPNPNSNPRETEDRVTRLVEEQVRTISGIRKVRSVSRADRAEIRVEFGGDQDLDLGYAEIRDRLEKIRGKLPRGSDRYFIFRNSLDESTPIFFGGLLFDVEPTDPRVNDICENILKRRIEGVDGVARMDIHGMLEESIRILLDVDRVRAHRVNLVELVTRLARDNFAVPAGKLQDGDSKYMLRVDSRLTDLEEIRDIPIGEGLKIRDIGEVRRVQAIRETLTRVSDLKSKSRAMKFALVCSITKSSGANTVEVCERVVGAMAELEARPDLAGFRFDPWFNQGRMIQKSLENLESAATDGGIWALAVLFFFLRRVRLTLLIALAIPVSLLATLVSLYFTGGTLNVISMAGITLAIGSLVDNAVVVVENVHRKKELGLPIKDAVTQGAGEVAVAITLATLTSIVVFVPLIFLSAQRSLRIAMAALGYTFSVSLLASLLAALVFIPVALYRLERDPNSRLERGLARVRGVLFWPFALPGKLVSRLRAKPAQPQAFAGEIESVTERSILLRGLKVGNEALLRWSLRHRLLATAVAALLMASTQYAISKQEISAGGGDDGSSVRIRIELPQNTTLAQASDELAFYENLCLGMYDDLKFFDMSSDFSRLGGSISIWFDRGFTRSEREEMRKKIRAAIPDRATSRALLDDMGMGGDAATGVRFVLLGRDSDQLAEFGERVKDQLLKVPQLTNVRSELERGRQEVRVRVDRAQAQKMSLNPTMISGAVEWGLRGYLLSRIQEKDIDRQLIIQYEGAENSTLQDLADTKLFTANGSDIPLSAVAHFEVGKSYGQIFRRDGKTSLAISADVLEGDAKSATALARKALAPLLVELPRDVQLDEEGALQDFQRDANEILGALWLSILLVFVVMAIMFENVVVPLSILITIPFAFFGAYWTLFLTKTPMDQVGMLGLIVLVGVVVNHGVVLVDHINFLRVREGLDRASAVIQGSKDRLRPVMMTSLTTIVGLIPMAIAREGAGDGISYRVLSRAVCGGLATSTFFTLWVVPLCYTFFDDLSVAFGRMFRAAMAPLGRRRAAAGAEAAPDPAPAA
jgi:HAE1 family hydrophobic/amphiphilic exporter-1